MKVLLLLGLSQVRNDPFDVVKSIAKNALFQTPMTLYLQWFQFIQPLSH